MNGRKINEYFMTLYNVMDVNLKAEAYIRITMKQYEDRLDLTASGVDKVVQ